MEWGGYTGFEGYSFSDLRDFMCCEASVNIEKECKLEAVATDGLPELLANEYVIVCDGLRSVGNVTVYR